MNKKIKILQIGIGMEFIRIKMPVQNASIFFQYIFIPTCMWSSKENRIIKSGHIQHLCCILDSYTCVHVYTFYTYVSDLNYNTHTCTILP